MCDTFAATPPATADAAVIFGKNSDREANEAQALTYHPARSYPAGKRLRCTYIDIPQAPATRAVLLCRPFWMWGAEMGVNAAGLAVGNEAVWTRMPLNRLEGLTGMDLVRLALERADTAEGGVEILAGLLNDFGQGGLCGYRDRRMAYHNSFILADPGAAWVLETAGPYWAAKQIKGIAAISNGLTLGQDFDRCHPDLAGQGRRLHFARRFGDRFYTFFSASRPRRACTLAKLEAARGSIDVRAALGVLQDHGCGDYRPDSHWLGDRVCAHAANGLTRNATQTTGSLVAHLKPGRTTVWVTATAAPCLSLFKPFWFSDNRLPDIGPPPGGRFDPETLWWFHEQFHRRVLLDFQGRYAACRQSRRALQQQLIQEAEGVPEKTTGAVTAGAFRRARAWTEARIQGLSQDAGPTGKPLRGVYRRYWEKLNRQAGISIAAGD
jgi:dipeptidase